MSTRPPLAHDPEVHHQLRRHYTTIPQNLDLQFEGPHAEDGTCLGLFSHGRLLHVIQGNKESFDPNRGRHHPYLAPKEAKHLKHHQLVTACLPLPMGPAEGPASNRKGIASTMLIKVVRVGGAQLWWGGGTGEIGEPNLNGVKLDKDPAPLHALWYVLENTLRERGCTRTYTPTREPTHPDDTYQAFLRERGYEPSEEYDHHANLAWVKVL